VRESIHSLVMTSVRPFSTDIVADTDAPDDVGARNLPG
jgi:hypothetical protein